MTAARCAVCGRKAGDRRCPSTDRNLCSRCCGSHRGRLFPCPKDCPYLQEAEERLVARRARELGRAWAAWHRELSSFDAEDWGYLEVLAEVLASLIRRNPADDREIVGALHHLDQALSPVVLVTIRPGPLGRTLEEAFLPLHRKGKIDGERMRKVARKLAAWLEGYRSPEDPQKFMRGLLGLFPPTQEQVEPGLIVRPGGIE